MTDARLRLILDCNSEQAARRVIARITGLDGWHVEDLKPYDKGGFEANLSGKTAAIGRADGILELIALAQSFGRSWALTGDINDELDLTSREFTVSGVTFAWLTATHVRS